MAIGLRYNAISAGAANQLGRTQYDLKATLSRVSAGTRINSAADDAAGSAVSTNLSTVARGTLMANRNARDAQSMIQTSEAALTEVISLVDRARELAVQSASETLEDDERGYIGEEMDQIIAEVKRIYLTSEFNDQSVAGGETYEVQVGTDESTDNRISLKMGDVKTAHTGLSPVDLTGSALSRIGIIRIDIVLDQLNTDRSRMGALHNRLDRAISNNQSKNESLMSAASRISDADMAFETSRMTANQVKMQAGVAVLSQAKQLSSSVLQLI
jgi:flagellin